MTKLELVDIVDNIVDNITTPGITETETSEVDRYFAVWVSFTGGRWAKIQIAKSGEEILPLSEWRIFADNTPLELLQQIADKLAEVLL